MKCFRSPSVIVLRVALVAALSGGCADTDAATRVLPEPDYDKFVASVYPVLLRDCGFPACHAQSARFFQAFGPGRARLDPATMPYDPATGAELQLAYERARSMLIDRGNGAKLPILLRKPLAKSAGGADHQGDDAWGQPVYKSTADPNYRVLEAWALGTSPADAGVSP